MKACSELSSAHTQCFLSSAVICRFVMHLHTPQNHRDTLIGSLSSSAMAKGCAAALFAIGPCANLVQERLAIRRASVVSSKVLASSEYRPDIEGLRAVAVLSVIGFHAFPTWFRGGFIGVDIFFVISGFLITRILSESFAREQFNVVEFYSSCQRNSRGFCGPMQWALPGVR
jgi:hypothetical protein